MIKDAKNLIVGLDIGTSKVVAVVAEVFKLGNSRLMPETISQKTVMPSHTRMIEGRPRVLRATGFGDSVFLAMIGSPLCAWVVIETQ